MPADRTHEFDDIVKAAKAEIAADTPKLRTGLDLTADASKASQAEMVQQVQAKWGDPEYRHDLVQRESPDNVVQLLLRANGVTNADGSPMTVHQYQTTVLEPFMATGSSPFIKPPEQAFPPNNPAPVAPNAAPPTPPPVPIFGPNGQVLPPSQPAAVGSPPPAAPAAPEAPQYPT